MSGGITITVELKPSTELLLAMAEMTSAIRAHAAAVTEADARTFWLSDMDQLLGRRQAEAASRPDAPPVPAAPIPKAPPSATLQEPAAAAPPRAAAGIGPEAPKPAVAAVPKPATAAGDQPLPLMTEARRALLRAEWPAGVNVQGVLRRFNDLLGRQTDAKRIGIEAAAMGLKRPAGFNAQTAPMTLDQAERSRNAEPGRLARALEVPKQTIDITTPIVTDAETIRARVATWGKQFSGPADLADINAHARHIGHRPFQLEDRRGRAA